MVRTEVPPANSPATYGIAERDVADAIVTVVQEILARYDDEAILGMHQDPLVQTIRDAVRHELRHRLPEKSASLKPRAFTRALTAYVTAEVRARQGWAFEQQLAHAYGPLDPSALQEFAAHIVEINGVTVVSTTPLAQSDSTKSA